MRAIYQFILFCLLLTSQAAYANFQLNLTPGVTPISHDIYNLHMTILAICVVIGIVVFGFMFYAILHHRKSLGAEPALFHEHPFLEVTWTIIPFLILIFMAIPATRVLININDTEKPDLTIKITGFQWKWKYDYLDQGVGFFSNLSTPYDQLSGKAPKGLHYLQEVDHPLVVPIHKKIRFLVTANDVLHSWWVPDLGVKRDAVPGFINESWARINRPGTYYGQCAELCGINHAYMPIVVIALSEKGFNDWVAQQKAPQVMTPAPTPQVTPAPGKSQVKPTTATQPIPITAEIAKLSKKYSKEELMKKGEQVYLSTCAVCHKPDGAGMPPAFPALHGGPLTTGPIAAHIDRVLNGKPGTAMQPFRDQLKEEDIAAVITYERNALGNSKGDVVQPDDIIKAKKIGATP